MQAKYIARSAIAERVKYMLLYIFLNLSTIAAIDAPSAL